MNLEKAFTIFIAIAGTIAAIFIAYSIFLSRRHFFIKIKPLSPIPALRPKSSADSEEYEKKHQRLVKLYRVFIIVVMIAFFVLAMIVLPS